MLLRWVAENGEWPSDMFSTDTAAARVEKEWCLWWKAARKYLPAGDEVIARLTAEQNRLRAKARAAIVEKKRLADEAAAHARQCEEFEQALAKKMGRGRMVGLDREGACVLRTPLQLRASLARGPGYWVGEIVRSSY